MKILNRIFPEIKMDQKSVKMMNIKQEPLTAYSLEDNKIKEIFDKNGQQLTTEKLQEIQIFMNETEGDFDAKLATVELAVEKDVAITAGNLKSIHAAVNEPMILSDAELTSTDIKNIIAELPKDVQNAIMAQVTKEMPVEKVLLLLIKSQLNSIFSVGVQSSNDTNGAVYKDVQMNGDEKVFIPASTTIPNQVNIKINDHEQVVHVNKSEDETHAVTTDDDFESESVKHILLGLEQLSEQLDELSATLLPMMSADLLTEQMPVQKVLEIEITEKMVEAKNIFDLYQKSISSQLERVLEQPEDKVQLKEVLLTVIDKLDHILMKTDVTLYTDIKTERDLLASSGQLEKARSLLGVKDEQAIEIIKSVKDAVDQIKFKPSSQKMFGITQKLVIEKLYDADMIKNIPFKVEPNMQMSPRAILEAVRALGINHEAEVAEILNKDQKSAFKVPQNMKSILMKLEESAQQKVVGKENLDHLTGQQLMNKLEIKSNKQKMMFQIPVQIEGKVQQLKVHVNTKKDHQKIDWKNSRLYFVIHLNKLGDTGVVVDVNNGRVNITIKNDHETLEEKISPFIENTTSRLEEVGFTNVQIKYETMNHVAKKENMIPVYEKEGFDVSI